MNIKAVRGTRDILPDESAIWSFIEKQARGLSELYGYREIRTPILEEARLFRRSIGEASDIVRKEMYSFIDRKKRLICLRPEATASVARAYLEHNLDKTLSLAKFYYLGPMFRAERPQAGRLRQFHHIGIEAIGSPSPYLDGEVILLALNMLQKIGVQDFTLQLNSIGCRKGRQNYLLILRKALKNKLKFLCPDCQSRYKVNILRIFDCKNEACKKITARLPVMAEHLCTECAEHFLQLKQILDSSGVDYLLNPHLVRGLDYYTKTCFEIVHPDLGAQNALGAGGRYDDLISDLGGPRTDAIGFALGLERILASLKHPRFKPATQTHPCVYIATIGAAAQRLAFQILRSLRSEDIVAEMNYQDKSLKGQLRLANKLGFKYVVILGEEELKTDTLILRNMQDQSQKKLKVDNLLKELKN